MKYNLTDEQRAAIESLISKDPDDDTACWQWNGRVKWGGTNGKVPVPCIAYDGVGRRAVAGIIYDMYIGLPDELTDDDLRWRLRMASTCHTAWCVNPLHREIVLSDRRPKTPEAEQRRNQAGAGRRKSPSYRQKTNWREQAEEYLESVS